jgi:hypothetical protein
VGLFDPTDKELEEAYWEGWHDAEEEDAGGAFFHALGGVFGTLVPAKFEGEKHKAYERGYNDYKNS